MWSQKSKKYFEKKKQYMHMVEKKSNNTKESAVKN